MTTEVEVAEKRKAGIYWKKPYAKAGPKELEVFSECIIDGCRWKVGPDGSIFSAGNIQEENTVAIDGDRDRPETQRPPVTKPVTPQKTRETTKGQDSIAKNVQRNVTDDKIFELSKKGLTTRAIGKILDLSHMTVARKLKGQRNLF